MNRYKLSLIHFVVALLAFMFGANLHGQEKPEMIPYTGWMHGQKLIKSAPKYSKVSKILPT